MKKVLFIASIVIVAFSLLFFFVWFLLQNKVIISLWLLDKMTSLYLPVIITLMTAIVLFVFTCPSLGNRSIRK